MNELRSLRIEKKITQQQAAQLSGISLRSYKSYETDESKVGSIKYNHILGVLSAINPVTETQGIPDIDYIKSKCATVLNKYSVNFCYLFGSYAKGTATQVSDIDLLISTDISGIRYFGIVEELRNSLHKKVDALDMKQVNNNPELLGEILKYGIKIYG